MAARSPQCRDGEWFTAPEQVNHRRYEALRAFHVEALTYAQAGQRFGYTRWAMVNLVREYRAGKLELFAPPQWPGPPPGAAPAKDRARGRVIELRRQGLSSYESSAQLATEGTPLNRTSVGEILAEEGFGRLLRHPGPVASTSGHARAGHAAAPRRPGGLRDLAGHGGHRQGWAVAAGADLVELDLPRFGPVLVVVIARPEADPHKAGIPRR